MAEKLRTDMNLIAIVGNLVQDAELKTVGNGFDICNMGVANNYIQRKNDNYEQNVNFFDCRILGKQATALSQYLKKGTKVAITGKLRQERWVKDEKKNSKVYVLVDEIQFVGGRPKQEEGQGNYDSQIQQTSSPQNQQGNMPDSFPEDMFF
jgi:single-strand DNA-binding protein